jgi:YegS/Rv2252/BmrU family lipid kinase
LSAGLLLVVNAAAGSADAAALDGALATLRGARDVEVARTSSPEDLDAVLDTLDGRALVVAGGDGSLHLAVARLRARGLLADVPVGLVPLGTGNDLARGLGLPLDPSAAAEGILHARPRTLDLIEADDGRVVVNASHAGLGAAAAQRSEDLKDALGAAAYPLGALLAGVRESGSDLTVTVDGAVVSRGPTLMVGIANGPSIGGGTPLAPGAVPDDGLLDVVVVTAVGPLARTAFAAALRRGTHVERDDVTTLRGREVEITGEPVPHDLDGEVVDPGPTRYRIAPAAWRLLGG